MTAIQRILLLLLLTLAGAGVLAADNVRLFRGRERYPNNAVKREFVFYRGANQRMILHGADESYYENGQKSSLTTFANGKRQREHRRWFTDGKIKVEGQYTDDHPDGVWKEYHANGRLLSQSEYRNGSKEGDYRAWYESGQVKTEGRYLVNQKDGVWKEYFANGTPSKEVEYRQGKNEGLSRSWHENGKLHQEIPYVNDQQQGVAKEWNAAGIQVAEITWREGGKDGLERTWYAHGGRRGEGTWRKAERTGENPGGSVKHGVFTTWRDDGVKVSEEEWQDGKRHGWQVLYDERGRMKSKAQFAAGKRAGQCFEWYPDGSKKLECTYANDQLEGPYQTWNPQGVQLSNGRYLAGAEYNGYFASPGAEEAEGLYRVVVYSEGQPTGTAMFENGAPKSGRIVEYYPSGTKRREYGFVKGGHDGPDLAYTADGKKESEKNWKDNRLEGAYRAWFPSGQLKLEATYEKGGKQGRETEYTEDGRKLHETEYQNDQRHGHHREWFAGGTQLKLEAEYSLGALNGKFQSWNEKGEVLSNGEYRAGKPWSGQLVEPGYQANQYFVNTYRDGALEDGLLYENGKLKNGDLVENWPLGQVKRQCMFKEGRRDGQDTMWYENGTKYVERCWRNNRLHGVYVEYFEDGLIRWSTELKDGVKHGRETHWYEPPKGAVGEQTRSVIADGIYQGGKPQEGTFVVSSPQGVVIQKFINGVATGLILQPPRQVVNDAWQNQ